MILSFLIFILFTETFAQETKIVSLFAAVRHGARAPTNNIWAQEPWYHLAKNQLTPGGMRQEFLVGRQLRADYADVLPPFYHPDSIVAITGDQPRITNSLQALLAGLFYKTGPSFPNKTSQEFYQKYVLPPIEINLNSDPPSDSALPNYFQPVPIHMNNMSFDSLTEFNYSCRGLFDHVWDMDHHNIVWQINKKLEDQLPILDEFLNLPVGIDKNFFFYGDIYDTLLADLYAGIETKFNSDDEKWDISRFIYDELEATEFRKKKFQQAFAGDFLKYIFDSMNTAVLDPETKKVLHIVQTHDSNLNALLSIFGLASPECLLEYFEQNKEPDEKCNRTPKYASAFVFELHRSSQNQSSYFVKFKMNDRYMQPCPGIKGEFCPWEIFGELAKEMEPKNLDQECIDPFWEIEMTQEKSMVSTVFGLCAFQFLLASTALCACQKIIKLKRKLKKKIPNTLLELGTPPNSSEEEQEPKL